MIKKILCVAVCLLLTLSVCGCEYAYSENKYSGDYDTSLKNTVLNVYNWGEYISDGSDDSLDVNREFERLTGIKVNYTTFESNETMYSQIKSGGVSYDVIIPSDYMIERMIREDMLAKLNPKKLSNYKYIADQYKGLFYDPDEVYTAAYNVGMVGIIYNSDLISNPKHSWTTLWDEKYRNMSLNFSNPRDGFMPAQMILGQNINSTNKKDWDKALDLLKKGKDVLQSYVMDEIYGKMETGEAAIGPYYAGDYFTMYDINDALRFFYPEEGTNIFVDAACIPKCAKNIDAARMYINFLLDPEIALANAEYICYASPNTAVINNPDYSFYQDEVLYPAEENMPKVQYYHDLPDDIRRYYEELWLDLKLY